MKAVQQIPGRGEKIPELKPRAIEKSGNTLAKWKHEVRKSQSSHGLGGGVQLGINIQRI